MQIIDRKVIGSTQTQEYAERINTTEVDNSTNLVRLTGLKYVPRSQNIDSEIVLRQSALPQSCEMHYRITSSCLRTESIAVTNVFPVEHVEAYYIMPVCFQRGLNNTSDVALVTCNEDSHERYSHAS